VTFDATPPAAGTIIRRYYVYAGIYTLAASVIWGINTLFLLDAGLTITEVFVANAAFSLGTMLFEIPTGVLADTAGRRTSFLVSLLVLSSTTVLYVWLSVAGGDVVAFSIVSALMGLGFTFYSGAMEAWLVDGATASGFTGGFDRVFSRAQIVSGAAMLVGTVGGGLLGHIHLAIPFLLRAGLLMALFVMAFRGMHDIGFTRRIVSWRAVPREANRIARLGVRFGWRQPSLRLLILAAAVQNGFFFWAWYAWQPYFLQLLERDAVWVAGVVAALLAASMMVGNAIVEFVSRWCGKRTTLLLWAGAAFSLSMAGVGLVDAFVPALALLIAAGIAMGVQMPVRQAFVHQFVPREQRATVVSFDSMVAGGFALVGQAGLGRLADRRGYSAGYVLGGAITLAAVPLLMRVRRRRDREDRFVGPAPIEARACAAEGLPAIASVDATTPVD
jgi:MFS family permease